MKNKNLIGDFEAKVLSVTTIFLLVIAILSSVLIIFPSNDITVNASSITDFDYYKEITIDYTQVPSTLTNFPVCINISSDTDLSNDAQADGDDIAFFDTGNNQLAHEIEKFDSGTGQLVVWVNVTSISSSSNTSIYLYYGNATMTNQENPTGVWDSNYLMVQHMNQSSGTLYDSTSNNVDTASDDWGTQGTASSVFGGACDKTNANSGSTITGLTWDLNTYTVEGYASFNGASGNNYNPVVATLKADGGFYLLRIEDVGNYPSNHYDGGFRVSDTSVWSDNAFSTSTLANDTWYYMAGTSDGSNIYLTVNGNKGSATSTGINFQPDTFAIGSRYNSAEGDNTDWEGNLIIDEIRVSNIERSDDWITTTYNNFKNGTDGGFFSVLSETENIQGTYTYNGLDGNGDFTWSGEGGDIVWCNDSSDGTNSETLNVYTNTSGTTENCTIICLDFDNIDSDLVYQNISIEVINSTDGVWDGTTHQVTDANGNVTLDSTVWAGASWCHGTNPFPIENYNSTIQVRATFTIPTDKGVGTYTGSMGNVRWYIQS